MQANQINHKGQDLKWQITGWMLFVVCAVLFIASSINNQDTLACIASVIFLISCIFFLVPLVRTMRQMEVHKKYPYS